MLDTYAFGVFHLDATEHLLLREGRPVALPPKAFDLLLDLVQHAGHLRNKKQLMDVLWPGTFVEEANLAYTVSALRKALGDERDHPKYIETVPTKGYRFVGEVRNPETPASERLKPGSDSSTPPASVPAPGPAEGRRLTPYSIAAVAVLAIAAGTWALFRFSPNEPGLPPPRIVSVTPVGPSSDAEQQPALSPDGHWIAFQRVKEGKANIYVKELDGSGITQLTNGGTDSSPAWSPDGRRVAYLHGSGTDDRRTLYLISMVGGENTRLTEVHFRSTPSWSHDGTHIAFADRESPNAPSSLWSLSRETREKRQLTSPPAATEGDTSPVYSPDGRSLAFVRAWSTGGRSAIYVMRLPDGEPTLVTDHERPQTLCWTADSQEIVFGTSPQTQPGLWRISVTGGEPHRIPIRGDQVEYPAISRNRLAYVTLIDNADLARVELTGRSEVKLPSKPVISWPSGEYTARISPDGSRIAFPSNSSGNLEMWMSRADGTNATQLTDMKSPTAGSPGWSPDGKWIAFDSIKSGNTDLYVVSADGGPVRRLTADASDETTPYWSRDGRWIYFGSNRTGSWQIWRMPPDGGRATQVTKAGGNVPRESVDGQSVYYFGGFGQPRRGVWRIPVSGGPETRVLDADIADALGWDVTDRGIYFREGATLCFYDFGTGQVSRLTSLCDRPGCWLCGLRVSPDGTWLLYTGWSHSSHIMMIDNFR